MNKRNKLKEAIATVRGATALLLTFSSPFIVLGVIALGRVFNDGPDELFLMGYEPLYKFWGAQASNLDVVVFCVIAIICVCIVILRRYLHYKNDIEFLRSKGIYDINEDGKIDSFADDLFDENT